MTGRNINTTLIIVGMAVALAAILIDPIRGYEIYLAPAQIVGLIVGLLIALAGVFLYVTGRELPLRR